MEGMEAMMKKTRKIKKDIKKKNPEKKTRKINTTNIPRLTYDTDMVDSIAKYELYEMINDNRNYLRKIDSKLNELKEEIETFVSLSMFNNTSIKVDDNADSIESIKSQLNEIDDALGQM